MKTIIGKIHNRHSNIDLSAVLVCNFVINNDNVLLFVM